MSDYDYWLKGKPRLPPLWPGEPKWVSDTAAFDRLLDLFMDDAMLRNKQMIHLLASAAIDQRGLDARWRHFCHIVQAFDDCSKSAQDWAKVTLEPAGWDARNLLRQLGRDTVMPKKDFQWAATQALNSGGISQNPSYKTPSPPIPKKCDNCKRECLSECGICGEPYCSRECLKANFKDHRKLCMTVHENCSFYPTLTAMEWRQSLTPGQYNEGLTGEIDPLNSARSPASFVDALVRGVRLVVIDPRPGLPMDTVVTFVGLAPGGQHDVLVRVGPRDSPGNVPQRLRPARGAPGEAIMPITAFRVDGKGLWSAGERAVTRKLGQARHSEKLVVVTGPSPRDPGELVVRIATPHVLLPERVWPQNRGREADDAEEFTVPAAKLLEPTPDQLSGGIKAAVDELARSLPPDQAKQVRLLAKMMGPGASPDNPTEWARGIPDNPDLLPRVATGKRLWNAGQEKLERGDDAEGLRLCAEAINQSLGAGVPAMIDPVTRKLAGRIEGVAERLGGADAETIKAFVCMAFQDMSAARRHAEKAVRLSPENAGACQIASAVSAAVGDLNRALKFSQDAARIAANEPKHAHVLGRVLKNLQRNEEAQSAFLRCIELAESREDEDYAPSLYSLATIAAHGKRESEAISRLVEAREAEAVRPVPVDSPLKEEAELFAGFYLDRRDARNNVLNQRRDVDVSEAVEKARSARESGNNKLRAGDAARAHNAYSEAVDVLGPLEGHDAAAWELALSLGNRAEVSLRLGGRDNATRAAEDLDWADALLQRFTGLFDPEASQRLCDKLRSRRQRAREAGAGQSLMSSRNVLRESLQAPGAAQRDLAEGISALGVTVGATTGASTNKKRGKKNRKKQAAAAKSAAAAAAGGAPDDDGPADETAAEDDGPTCAICLEGSEAGILCDPCGHGHPLHHACLAGWRRTRRREGRNIECPTCRRIL